MKVGYISDFFVDEIYGGAEIVDDIIMKSLSNVFEIHRIKSSAQLLECDFYILSNFFNNICVDNLNIICRFFFHQS